MGCNCKGGKAQKLNNLDSSDHLKVAFDTFKDLLQNREEGLSFDETESKLLINTFYSVYPNAKGEITPEHAALTIKNIYNQYYGRK